MSLTWSLIIMQDNWLGMPPWAKQQTIQSQVRQNIGDKQIKGVALAHQTVRGQPRYLTDNAKYSGWVTIDYRANTAAHTSKLIKLDTHVNDQGLPQVWYLGTKYPTKGTSLASVYPVGGGSATTYADNPTKIYGASCGFQNTPLGLNISVASTNIGVTEVLTAVFFYMVSYDQLKLDDYFNRSLPY